MYLLPSKLYRSLPLSFLFLGLNSALAAGVTPPLFEINVSGYSGMDGAAGRDYRGSRARDGWSGSDGQRGGDGADGRSATDGLPGGYGGQAGDMEVWISSDSTRPGIVQIRGTFGAAGDARAEIPLRDIPLQDGAKIELVAHGGDGGTGGRGGSGEDGGRGGRGGRATQWSYRSGDGGAGGRGGDGAAGADGGNGGNGGKITLHLKSGDEGLMKWIDADVSGGLPGRAGSSGHAGYGGHGGDAGDRCYYKSGRGTVCVSPGSTGRDGYSGHDGIAYPHEGAYGQSGALTVTGF